MTKQHTPNWQPLSESNLIRGQKYMLKTRHDKGFIGTHIPITTGAAIESDDVLQDAFVISNRCYHADAFTHYDANWTEPKEDEAPAQSFTPPDFVTEAAKVAYCLAVVAQIRDETLPLPRIGHKEAQMLLKTCNTAEALLRDIHAYFT